MSDFKDPAKIEEMRRRLYERGTVQAEPVRHVLTATPPVAPPIWQGQTISETLIASPDESLAVTLDSENLMKKRRRFSYRSVALLGSLAVFLVVLGLSSLYLMFGNTQISSKNISINITGPLTIGGGEVMPIQIGVTNQNKVAIESVVVIVTYPAGTKSADPEPKDLFEERVTLNRINPGEAINVPVRAVMFGEENQEHQILARIEYRLIDSNGIFEKEADPLTFKINSSPLIIRVDSLEKVSAGQDVEITLTVQSNAPTPLKDILISSNFPNNFDFTSATPEPSYRESAWLIKEILPGKSVTIVIKGSIVGQQSEEFQMQFSAGTPKQDNEFTIGSVLANATADFKIEQPFINVGIGVNNFETDVVTLKTGDSTLVTISVQNTLSETLYDMALEVGVKGNILVRESVLVQNGFYDSAKDVIRFEPSGDDALSEVNPGETKKFTFTLRPSDKKETPSFSLTANAYARRVQETRATEQLVGTAKTEVKFTSSVAVGRTIARNVPGFVDVGPVPPVADAETTYTVMLFASAGGNDVTGGTLVTSLPQYVSWKNVSSGDGSLVFNPISKELTWTVGAIEAGAKKTITFQVGLVPSQNQIGSTPAILGAQRFRATDRFTSEVIRAEGVPASSELGPESGLEEENGKVLKTAL